MEALKCVYSDTLFKLEIKKSVEKLWCDPFR